MVEYCKPNYSVDRRDIMWICRVIEWHSHWVQFDTTIITEKAFVKKEDFEKGITIMCFITIVDQWYKQLEAGHTIECVTHASYSIAFTLWPYDIDLWPFDLIFLWARTVDHHQPPGGKLDDCSFSHFWFYRADKQTHRRVWMPYFCDFRQRE